ncbi:hypothetical protein HAX54_023679 [Datura stramonium]|uniref:Uncharacterized protein n=1 Tax=Datura stramonium TaxID=4076 RepID=A0ABS8UYY2_DATST|nr:hypothetical protein [Datura stramonium]
MGYLTHLYSSRLFWGGVIHLIFWGKLDLVTNTEDDFDRGWYFGLLLSLQNDYVDWDLFPFRNHRVPIVLKRSMPEVVGMEDDDESRHVARIDATSRSPYRGTKCLPSLEAGYLDPISCWVVIDVPIGANLLRTSRE